MKHELAPGDIIIYVYNRTYPVQVAVVTNITVPDFPNLHNHKSAMVQVLLACKLNDMPKDSEWNLENNSYPTVRKYVFPLECLELKFIFKRTKIFFYDPEYYKK